jgi:hypothetical protein
LQPKAGPSGGREKRAGSRIVEFGDLGIVQGWRVGRREKVEPESVEVIREA